MAILRLKTDTKQQMVDNLCNAGMSLDEFDELITATHDYFVSMCGELKKDSGVMLTDEDGNEYAEKVAIAGYHANLVTDNKSIINAVSNIVINVNSPIIKIAGEL